MIVVVFVLPWRRWSLGEGEGTHRDHHQSDAELGTLKRMDYDGSFTVNYTHCILAIVLGLMV